MLTYCNGPKVGIKLKNVLCQNIISCFLAIVAVINIYAILIFLNILQYSTKLWWEKTLADLVVHCQSAKVLSAKKL